MKVKELVEKLQALDPEGRVFFVPAGVSRKSRWWATAITEIVEVGSLGGGEGAEVFDVVMLRGVSAPAR